MFLLYGVSPAHAWLDAGEIAAAGAELGVLHPPGVPGLTHLMRASLMVPIGTMGFRIAATSAALGAATVVVVWLILRRHRVHAGVRWASCLWVLASLTFVRQARVAEIYAAGTFLLVLVIWAFDPRVPQSRRDRMRLVGVFFAAIAVWGFGDLRLALVPWLAWAGIRDARRKKSWVRWAPLVAGLGSVVVVALPLSAVRMPITGWGDPDGLWRLWSHLQAEAIRDSFRDDILPASVALWWVHAAAAVARLLEDVGPLGFLIGLGALGWLTARGERPRRRGLALVVGWVLAAELFYAVGVNPMGGPDRQTGMVFGPLLAMAVGLAVHGWTEPRPRLRWGLVPVLGAALFVPAALASMGDVVETRSWGPHRWTRSALDQLPPGSLLLTQSDDMAAGALYARVHEGARPDALVIPAQHLYRPPSHRVRNDARWNRIWTPAHGQPTETSRIVAAIEAHPGPVALEMPGAGIFAAVPWWSGAGRVPLAVSGPGPWRPGADETVDETVGETVDYWLPRLPAPADRRRLAIALSNRARALLRQPGSADLAEAQVWLETSLRRVRPDHAASLVAAGVVVDRRGRPDVAIELTRRALALEPHRETALTNLALYLARSPATRPEALELARRATALRPWHHAPWVRLAEIAALSGDLTTAQVAREHAGRLGVEPPKPLPVVK